MNTPPIVSPQEWKAAREELLVKEKELTRARDALAAERRRMPRMAVEKEYAFEGPDGPASLLDLFEGRRQLIVYRFFFEPGVHGLARERLPRLLDGRRPGRPPRPPERPRHDARVRLARAAGGHRALEGADGLGDIPWYTLTDDFDADFDVDEWHGTNAFLRDGDRDLPHLLRRQARRRGDGQHLELPRHHRARAPGDLGGLAGGLPADPGLRLVEPPRRVRRRGQLRARPLGATASQRGSRST